MKTSKRNVKPTVASPANELRLCFLVGSLPPQKNAPARSRAQREVGANSCIRNSRARPCPSPAIDVGRGHRALLDPGVENVANPSAQGQRTLAFRVRRAKPAPITGNSARAREVQATKPLNCATSRFAVADKDDKRRQKVRARAPKPSPALRSQAGAASAANRSSIACYPHRKKIGGVHRCGLRDLGRDRGRHPLQDSRREKETDKLAAVLDLGERPVRPGEAGRPTDPKRQAPDVRRRQGARERSCSTRSRSRAPTPPARRIARSLLVQAGKLDDAIAEYKRGQGASGLDGVLAREGLGLALESEGRAPRRMPPRARRASRTALATFKAMQPDDKGPRRAYALYHQGRMLALLGKTADAKTAFEKAKELGKDSAELAELVDKRLASLGHVKHARARSRSSRSCSARGVQRAAAAPRRRDERDRPSSRSARIGCRSSGSSSPRIGCTEIAPQEFAAPAVVRPTRCTSARRAARSSRCARSTGTDPLEASTSARSRARRSSRAACCTSAPTTASSSRSTRRPATRSGATRAAARSSRRRSTTGDLIVFANEADQVVAIDAITGKFKWQYKTETPEEYTLRGHAGVAIDGDLLYTGFSNGTLVALRKDTGSVAWSTSLKGDADRFMDVDATPLVHRRDVYASSSSGGVYALDKATGLVRWRVPFYDVVAAELDGQRRRPRDRRQALYVSVADLGTYAIDLDGNVMWRVGARGGGEPGAPVVFDDLLVYSLAEDGLFLADRKTGETRRVLRSRRRRLGAADDHRRRPAVRDVEPRHPVLVRSRLMATLSTPAAPGYSGSQNGSAGFAIR